MTHHFDTELRTGFLCRHLSTGWHMRILEGPAPRAVTGQVIAASVPGTIRHDLATAGLLASVKNEPHHAWIGKCVWEYSLDFPWRNAGTSHTELIFRGLPKMATASINGHLLGVASEKGPQHHDVGALLFEGINTLKVSLPSRKPTL